MHCNLEQEGPHGSRLSNPSCPEQQSSHGVEIRTELASCLSGHCNHCNTKLQSRLSSSLTGVSGDPSPPRVEPSQGTDTSQGYRL